MVKVRAILHTFWLRWVFSFIGVVIVALGSVAATYGHSYQGHIYPGVKVGVVDVGGLTPTQAEAELQHAWDQITSQGIRVVAGQRSLILFPIISAPNDPDITYELMRFDSTATALSAYQIGRQGSWWRQLVEPLALRVEPRTIDARPDIDLHRITDYFKENLSGIEIPAQTAQIVVDAADNVEVKPAVPGLVIDQVSLGTDLARIVGTLQVTEPLQIQLVGIPPTLAEADVMALIPQVKQLLRPMSLRFSWQQSHWSVSPQTWHHWLEVRPAGNGLEVGLSQNTAADFFVPVLQTINITAQNARFEVKDGRVATFEPSQNGRNVDVSATLTAAEQVVRSGDTVDIPLVITEIQPSIRTADANSFGIADIIGIGTSSFAGSPLNRIHNISVGAAKLNGVLVKPGEEFSLIKTLGEIDNAAGYLQELVIKGNKTIPEYGGGLCQIGTTTFRAALASGLPILERRNHSYRVSYYEPAGTDATIYDPKPDFRFKNDTSSNILIQTKIKGTKLTFEFWGQPDGRKVEQTKPQITNITPPPPSKLVQTEDLPVGQKKCTEHAHDGADAQFTYTVTYADSRQVQQVFKSHYIPWQEVCLVGVPKGSLSKTGSTGDGSMLLPSADIQGQSGN